MTARARGGQSLYGENDLANVGLLSFITMMSGKGNFSFTELQKATAGKQASASLSMNEYTDVVSGQSTVKDLETMFQLAYLTFTDIRKDEKSYGQLMGQLETMLKNQGLTPESAFSDSVEYTLNNHDWRS